MGLAELAIEKLKDKDDPEMYHPVRFVPLVKDVFDGDGCFLEQGFRDGFKKRRDAR